MDLIKLTGNRPIQPSVNPRAEIHSPLAREAVTIESTTVAISPLGKTLNEGTGSNASGESIADIMSGKSLRNIRYSELVSVADKLRAAGHLAENDYLDFIGPSPEFSMLDGSRNPSGDAPMDYIGRHEMNIAFMKSSGAEQRHIDFENHLLSLYKSFET